jgi:predicted nucleotidyltransferase
VSIDQLGLLRILRNNVRNMRKSPIVDALFPQVRGRILAATLTRPEKRWYLSELAVFLHTRPSSLQREVDALCKAGILEQRRDGRRIYLRPDARSPVFPDLKSLFEKTAGVTAVLRQTISLFEDRIQLAFVYGSMALSEERSESDVDLMVIGSLGLSDLVPALRSAEKNLGRPVNATVFSLEEFKRMAQSGDHFLDIVLKGAKDFVMGDGNELEAIVREGRGPYPPNQQGGA